MTEKILVPVLGESITEATISKWLKRKGESIDADEPIVELETDKVNIEVPSPIEGTLAKINFKNGDVVEVGAILGEISAGTVNIKEEKVRNKEDLQKKESDNVVSFEKEKKQKPKIFEDKKKNIISINFHLNYGKDLFIILNKDLLTISISGSSGICKLYILWKNLTYDLLI